MKNWLASDLNFNSLYPDAIREAADKHWTRIEVAKKAAEFLAISSEAKVLDIGSGAGKFCIVAAHEYPKTHFFGVEQRQNLVDISNGLAKEFNLHNVSFICDNICNIDFKKFDHFYFYNSFYENVPGTQKIDYAIKYSEDLYNFYNRYLYKQLNKKQAGTRLVTYHSFGSEIPPGYQVVQTDYSDFLKFWIKV